MSKTKNGGLHQQGAKPFEQQQFGTAGVEWVKSPILLGEGREERGGKEMKGEREGLYSPPQYFSQVVASVSK